MASNINKLFDELQKKHSDLASATPANTSEKPAEKRLRIKYLRDNPEEWFKYYFPAYCQRPDGTFIEPAPFHKEATQRVLDNPEWYEVRNWSRELAKSTRTMMEVLYLALTGQKKSIILVSNSESNAQRLLLPYQVNLEKNNRIINDYGEQKAIGTWETGEFITKKGVVFRAVGAGQSPRGRRTDVILIDDMDTDEDCRNPEIIDYRWKWIEEALIPTRHISIPLLIIFCGNIIAEDCCVVRAAVKAQTAIDQGMPGFSVDKVNIRNEAGKSSWPDKNSEADIDRVLSLISYASQQKEYFNNPMSDGKTFPQIIWGECPPLKDLPFVVCYADPSTGNKDKPGAKSTQGNSRKAIFIMGRLKDKYYIYYGFLDVMSSTTFINDLYACRGYIDGQAISYFYIENNTLQDPIYSQIYLRLLSEVGQSHPKGVLGVTPDTREKKDKWFRIEAGLEPINTQARLIFNIREKDNPHMQRLEAQFKAAKPTSKQLDGPDAIEGAKYIIDQKLVANDIGGYSYSIRERSSEKYY